MINTTVNQVRNAVDNIGGATVTSNLLGVSNGCIYSWIKQNRVTNIFYARKLADLAKIPVEVLRPV